MVPQWPKRPNAPSLVWILWQSLGMALKPLHLIERSNILRFSDQGWHHNKLCLPFDFRVLSSAFNDSPANPFPFTHYLLCPASPSSRDQSPQTTSRCYLAVIFLYDFFFWTQILPSSMTKHIKIQSHFHRGMHWPAFIKGQTKFH